ncbi:MAG: hypothetical protein RBU37_24880 [Myxococcota bacterium]|nr:hypothetical protein [Myxococcota bacterium]
MDRSGLSARTSRSWRNVGQQEVGGTGQAPNRQELGGTGQVPNRQELGGTGQVPNRQELQGWIGG